MLVHQIERRYFPVVKDFKVTSIERSEAGILIQGTMRKVRDCEFLQLTAYVDNTQPVKVIFRDANGDGQDRTREVGFQLWGPWEIASNTHSHIDLYSRHKCHLLWQQSGKVLELTIPSGILVRS